MCVWKNKYSINRYQVWNKPIIRILPGTQGSDLFVFTRDGYVHEVSGFDFKIMNSIKISERSLTCVQEIAVRDARSFVVADIDGNIKRFTSSFEIPKVLGKKEAEVTAIEGIGRSRILISYPIKKFGCRVEMIDVHTGEVYASLDYKSIWRIKDLCCPEHKKNRNDGYVMGVSDQEILTINYKMFALEQGGIQTENPKWYFDEIACDLTSFKVARKEILRIDEEKKYDNVPYATSEEDKISTVTCKNDTFILTEGNRIWINVRLGKVKEFVELNEGECFITQQHDSTGRIIGGTFEGKLIVIDFRLNSLRFIFD